MSNHNALAPDVFLIAGEPSGDILGASLMRGLKASSPEPVRFMGIGGGSMQAEGLESLLPMDELCVIGLWEILSHLPRLLRLLQGIVEEIEEKKPAVVVTIDLPDFNFELAKRLKKRGIYKGKIVHYVAPSVWAWRPGRAKTIAQFLDGLMCLFPFEPDYFKNVGLLARYVGHPLIEVERENLQPQAFRQAREIDDKTLCLGIFFGSRVSEIQAMSDVLIKTVEALSEQYPDICVIAPTLPSLELEVLGLVKSLGVRVFVDTDVSRKWDAFSACNVALAVSGTVGLELAYLGVPHIVAYKAHPVTAMLVRALAKIKHVHLANILLKRSAVPEFLQGKCNPLYLTKALMQLIRYEEERAKQKLAFDELREALKLKDGLSPSGQSAKFVRHFIAKSKEPQAPSDADRLERKTAS